MSSVCHCLVMMSSVCHCLVMMSSVCHCLVMMSSVCHCLVMMSSVCHCLVIMSSVCHCLVMMSAGCHCLVMNSTSTFSPDCDVVPATLIKANIGTLIPVLTCIVNLSIESSNVPKVMRNAVVTPLLKKSGLDSRSRFTVRLPTDISNLSFISIRQCKWSRMIYLTSAHSCETVLVRIQDDILVSLDNRKTVILVLLDLSAAFDTIDHCLLLDQLYRIGIRGNAHR